MEKYVTKKFEASRYLILIVALVILTMMFLVCLTLGL